MGGLKHLKQSAARAFSVAICQRDHIERLTTETGDSSGKPALPLRVYRISALPVCKLVQDLPNSRAASFARRFGFYVFEGVEQRRALVG